MTVLASDCTYIKPLTTTLLSQLQQFGQDNQNPKLLRWQPSFSNAMGTGVKIALLDSGIEWHHPLFAEANIQAQDFTGSGNLADATGHGTHMANILVGQAGLVPDATLLFGKVLKSRPHAKSEQYITQGILWAIQQRVDILVLPLGRTRTSSLIQSAIHNAGKAGIRIFAAAGNMGSDRVLFPANLDGVNAVTGADPSGNVIPGCAQGTAVNSIALGTLQLLTTSDQRVPLLGSSPATVIASALAALSLSIV